MNIHYSFQSVPDMCFGCCSFAFVVQFGPHHIHDLFKGEVCMLLLYIFCGEQNILEFSKHIYNPAIFNYWWTRKKGLLTCNRCDNVGVQLLLCIDILECIRFFS